MTHRLVSYILLSTINNYGDDWNFAVIVVKELQQSTSHYTASKLRQLLTLEAEYGSLPEYTPALSDVINYLNKV